MANAGLRLGLASLVLVGANNALQNAIAEGDTRTLSFRHLHTDETITVTYKRNGRYDDAALKKLDWFLRDWRRDQSIRMNPHLFDLVWETNREVGGTQAIEIISAYRSPETNSMLRSRSNGVAKASQHTQGQAMDFHIPGVPLEKVRIAGLRLQRGGVGFYPSSGSPFVHLDTGSIRHWPRMSPDQLAKVFPDGRTVHVPSDGVPLSGYAVALADVERRGNAPSSTSLEAAREAGIVTAQSDSRPARSLLASLFRASTDEDEQSELPAPKAAQKPVKEPAKLRPPAPIALASLTAPTVVAVQPIVPLPSARPKLVEPVTVTAALPKPRPALTVASAAFDTNLFENSGYWRGAVATIDLARPAQQAPFQTASADPSVLAYASEAPAPAVAAARARPMGAAAPLLPREAPILRTALNTTIIAKQLLPVLSFGGQNADSPWLRATMLAPSVNAMTATRIGAEDPRPLATLMVKPSEMLLMSFSADPHLGLLADRFSGSAVVFLATASFGMQTAALR